MEDASHTYVGGKGVEGFNVNVAWNGGPMGDDEYIAAFYHVLLPVAYEVCKVACILNDHMQSHDLIM